MARETSQKIIETIVSVKGDKASASALRAFEKEIDRIAAKLQSIGGKIGPGKPVYLGKETAIREGEYGSNLKPLKSTTSKFGIPMQVGGKQIFQEIGITQGVGMQTQITATAEGYKELGKVQGEVIASTDKHGKAVSELGINYAKLAIRSMAVIPIWMAMRTAFQSVIISIQNAVRYMIDLEKGLATVKSLLVGTSGANEIIGDLRDRVKELATETGIATPELTNAFRNFVDAGINAKDSFDGMNASVRLAVALQGDLGETSRMLADTYNLMSDNLDANVTAQEFFNDTSAMMASLSQTNTFRLNEFIDGLKTFAPNAQTANLSLKEMLVLLATSHTFMRRGGQAGTLLSRVFNVLAKNSQQVGRYLGETIDPTTINNFELFTRLVERLNQDLQTGANILPEIQDMFDIRAGSEMASFVSNAARFTQEWSKLRDAKPEELMAKMNEMFKINVETSRDQLNIMRELRAQIIESFVTGVTGADNFTEELSKVNELLKQIKDGAEDFGFAMREALIIAGLSAAGPLGIAAGLNIARIHIAARITEKEAKKQLEDATKIQRAAFGEMSKEETEKLITDIKSGKIGLGGLNLERTVAQIQSTQSKKEKELKPEKQAETEKDINDTIEYRLMMLDRLKVYGIDEMEIEKRKLAIMIGLNDEFEQKLKIQRMMNEEALKYADILRKSLSEELKGTLFEGKGLAGLFSSINEAMIKSYRETVAEGLANMLMSTGVGDLFGKSMTGLKSIFTGATNKIESSFDTGGKIAHDWIVRGFSDASMGRAGGAATVGGGALTYVSSYGASQGWAVGDVPFSTGGGFSPRYGIKGGRIGPATKGQKAISGGKVIGGVTQGAMTGYSAYQSARAGGISQGQSVASGVLTGIGGGMLALGMGFGGVGAAMAGGLMAGLAAIGPVGWIALAAMAGGMALGMFGKKKSSQTSVEVKTSENRISSKIDVTNKNLEIINRNLIALKGSIETYILPSSAYFQEKTNIEDQFSLMSRMGFHG